MSELKNGSILLNFNIPYTMLDNHLYNLMLQMTEENKSLWRIKNNYLSDAGDCADCKAFWEMLEKDKQEHINDLLELIKKHL